MRGWHVSPVVERALGRESGKRPVGLSRGALRCDAEQCGSGLYCVRILEERSVHRPVGGGEVPADNGGGHPDSPVKPTAGVGKRAVAWLVDLALLVVIVYVSAILVEAAFGPTVRFGPDAANTAAEIVTVDRSMAVVNAVVGTSLSALYAVVSWMRWAATPGQRLLGLRVQDGSGRGLSPQQAIGRWLLLFPPLGSVAALTAEAAPGLGALLWLITPIWYLVLVVTTVRHPRKQGLHDRLAGTVVCPPTRAVDAVADPPTTELPEEPSVR